MILIPPGHAQLSFLFDTPAPGGLRRSVCTMGVEIDGLPSKLTQVNNAFVENIWTPLGSQSCAYRGIIAVTAEISYEQPRNIVGPISKQPCTPNTCILVRKTTDFRGRMNRGRNYWPGMCYEDDMDSTGVLDPADHAGYQQNFQDFYDELVGAEVQPVILHEAPALPTYVTGFAVDNVVATQRRRLRK